MTKKRVAQAPVKANAGMDTKVAPRLSNMAIHAPKAAPAETPEGVRVCQWVQ